ncbi:MAG: adenosylcobinamide amidohydrolase [Halobacteriales archaeon]
MFEARIREGVLRVRREGTAWLSSGWNGGRSEGPAAYNVSVPEGWHHEDVAAYVADRRERAGFAEPGPTLLTGVDLEHLRGARRGSVVAYATAGVSNPAALPPEPSGNPEALPGESPGGDQGAGPAGTVNLILGTTRSLEKGGLANLLATVVEAKTATALAEAGVPGTTTDAAVVACDPAGEPTAYAGSATSVGANARACVREAVGASLRSRYPDRAYPASVAEAEHGVRTNRRAAVFDPRSGRE